jgi:hypothetical protein
MIGWETVGVKATQAVTELLRCVLFENVLGIS